MKKIYIFGLLMIAPLTMTAVLASSYEGDLSPDISDGLEVSLPCNPASVSNGTVNATTCAITCNSNYTLNGTTCVANTTDPGPTGPGPTADNCPGGAAGDYSPSRYDGTCGTAPTTGNVTTGGANDDTNDQPSIGSIEGSPFGEEFNNAYLYAYSIGVTTQPTIQQANMEGQLIRSHMAKMMVNYAVRVLDRQPDANKVCEFNDITNESTELQGYMRLACQLGIMGIQADGTPMSEFNPNNTVTRAQFGTVLSRVLYGDQYNTPGDAYYTNHLTALQLDGIITNTDPTLQELRGYVMIMLMRAAD